jgi:Fe-S-cluster containining protein
VLGGTLEGKPTAINFTGVYDFTCFRCGTCCSRYQPRLSLNEAHNLADKLKVSWEDFLEQYTDRRWPGTQSFLIRAHNDACLFLQTPANKKQRLCLIHLYKPACCREWQSGLDHPECRQGLFDIWRLIVDSTGHLCGSPENVQEFEVYVNTLSSNPSNNSDNK